MRLNAYSSSNLYKEHTKKYHDKKIVEIIFHIGKFVLLFKSRLRLFPRKLKSKWSSPYIVKGVKPYGAIDGNRPTSHNHIIRKMKT